MPTDSLFIVYSQPFPESGGPAVSVVIPAYNSAGPLERALASVNAQTFRDFEIIVVDDGSRQDDSGAALRYLQTNVLPGRVIRQDNAGRAGALNTGIAASSGRYIALLDTEDSWRPEKLARVMAALSANPGIDLLAHDCAITRAGKTIGRHICAADPANARDCLLYEDNPLIPSATVFGKTAALKIGGFRESPDLQSVEDHDFCIRMCEVTGFYFLHEVLCEHQRPPRPSEEEIARHYGNLDTMLSGYYAALYADGAPGAVRKRINRRRASVQRSWAKELLLCGAGAAAGERVRAMNRLDRFDGKNAAVTLWWLLKKITAEK
ncbi:MAG: glycosyltransferase family A protein [Elusimicrobiaceae bacterium]|nr:glycosyltransferase family A protein [Elusimicrobiaceae bacterium]